MEEDYKNFKKEFTALEMRVIAELPALHSQIANLNQEMEMRKAELSLIRNSVEGIKKSIDTISQRISALEASKIKWWQR